MEGEKMDFKCEKCGKVFKKPSDLERHKNKKTPCIVENLSPEELVNPNRCLHCNKIYSKKENLTRHIKSCKIKVRQSKFVMNEPVNTEPMYLELEINKPDKIEIGYIYFITEIPFNNKVKIGMSKNPLKRIKQLQTGNPSKLVIYYTFESEDYKLLERTLHNICADKKIINEWFEMEESELQSLISGL
ncbi:hypothetical protein PV-S19_0175 [Pacmanvirus S19]|nr:hypothetical protein PV-S19_0175 [Pacmanvirus S19]